MKTSDTERYRGFESHPLRHIGTSCARSDFFLHHKIKRPLHFSMACLPLFRSPTPPALSSSQSALLMQIQLPHGQADFSSLRQPVVWVQQQEANLQRSARIHADAAVSISTGFPTSFSSLIGKGPGPAAHKTGPPWPCPARFPLCFFSSWPVRASFLP